MKFVSFNINDHVKVKLTDDGKEILRGNHAKLMNFYAKAPLIKIDPLKIEVDEEGYTRFQMWELMYEFGGHVGLGALVPFETTIQVEVKDE